MASKFTSPDFLPQFIDKYRELSCLWDVRSRDYSNRYKRDEALKELKELCKAVCIEPTEDYVKNKIANLRTVFKKEYKKIQASKKSGAGAEDVYVPRLWYFKDLMFLADSDNPRESHCTLEASGPSDSGALSEAEDISQTQTQDTPSPVPEQPGPSGLSAQRGKKRKTSDLDTSTLLRNASSIMEQKDDECDAVGYLVAHKLRRMTMQQRDLFEPLLHKMMGIGLKGHLTPNTDVIGYQGCTYHQPVPSVPNWQTSQQHGTTSWPMNQEHHQGPWFRDPHYTNL
ncbi:uncharacterized protein LOC143941123 [Lithobates pipiens]